MTTAPAQLDALPWDLQWLLIPGAKTKAAQAVLQLPNMRRQLEIQFRQWGVLRQLPQTTASKAAGLKALRAMAKAEKSYERVMQTLWLGIKRADRAGKLPAGSIRLVDVRDNHNLTAQERGELGAFAIASLLVIIAGAAVASLVLGYIGTQFIRRMNQNATDTLFATEMNRQYAAVFDKTGRIPPGLIDRTSKPGAGGSPTVEGQVGTIALAVAAIAAFWFFSRRRARA